MARSCPTTASGVRLVAGCGVSAAGLVGLFVLMTVIFPPFFSKGWFGRREAQYSCTSARRPHRLDETATRRFSRLMLSRDVHLGRLAAGRARLDSRKDPAHFRFPATSTESV